MSNPKPKYNCMLPARFSGLELDEEDLPAYVLKSRQGWLNITGGNGSQYKKKHPTDEPKLKQSTGTPNSLLFFK